MTRMKTIFAALVLVAFANLPLPVHAQTVKIVLAGSSALWQSMALAAYSAGSCVSGGTAPCFHFTAKNFSLTDTRPTTKTGGTADVDLGNVWVVWDSNTTSTNVWAFIKVDSGVGDRCYFAQPHCNVSITTFPSPANLISSTLWGDSSSDSTPPAAIQTLFTSGTLLVSGAATDIRPEDALFATCRANSVLGGGVDGLAGLGYNSVNASGTCVKYAASNTLAMLAGSDILSGYPASTNTAHVLEFALSGKDPFTGTTVPPYTTVSVGAAPVVFITERTGALATVTNATDAQLQSVFSGANCNASAFGAPSGNIQAFLREPLSGTMNTTEYNVFRYVTDTGQSQETGVNATNPLAKACSSGGSRYRAIGTSEMVESVQNSQTNNGTDGIGYAFFSYGNVSSIANNANYGYLTLDGIDGIFHVYGTTIDPGQPSTPGMLPAAANLPASCAGAFPCAESKIWSGNLSFPNVRNGSYRAWSILRIVSGGTALAAGEALATASQAYVVTTVPDFIPAIKKGTTDPGLSLLRSHYEQEGVAPVNIATTGDKGGDVGGCILYSAGTASESDTTTGLAQQAPGSACVIVP